MKYPVFLPLLILSLIQSAYTQYTTVQYQPFTLDFEIEETHETASENPFTDYRLDVTFSLGELQLKVPGYYAADGDAAQSSADSGGVWRVHFSAPEAGDWNYRVSFKKGKQIATDNDPYLGTAVEPHNGKSGTLQVEKPANGAVLFETAGPVMYNNSRYLYTRNGEPLMIFGTNSPENFLAYEDIDGTYAMDPSRDYIKSWEPHVRDWKKGDPTWQGGKGKGIIGALNYLASKEMNALYLLTLNIEGDSMDVWPFISHHRRDFKRYDVSKLAQWDIVFSHAEALGIVIEVITQEQENQLLLDGGDNRGERKLYYRELIARFSHHKNIIWNIGEENGYAGSWPHGQNDQQRYSMIRYIKENDPYGHPVLMHTYPHKDERDEIVNPLMKYSFFDGLSMQVGHYDRVHTSIEEWVQKRRNQQNALENRPWIVLMDEIGPYFTGTKPDSYDPSHDKERKNVLWPALMAGAAGVQWYFGWVTPPHDLNAEDLRSRNNIWEQSAHARQFFEKIDYTEMQPSDYLLQHGDNHCFSKAGESYVIYMKYGGTTQLDLSESEETYSIQWYNPRSGGNLIPNNPSIVRGGNKIDIGPAPSNAFDDWVVLVSRVQ